jgi:aminomethyltransferase
VLETLARSDLSGLRYYRFLPEAVLVGGVPVSIARCGYTGELGYELYTEPAHAERLLDAIIATRRVRPYGVRAMETLRREAGLILVGIDFQPGDGDPFELGLDRVVRLAKPAFRGRDALLQRSARGLVRRLASLVMNGDDPPAPGAEVRASGRAVGEVRSAGPAPTVGRPVALAVLEVAEIEAGRPVEIDGLGARVTTHPAYDPEKLRPRS